MKKGMLLYLFFCLIMLLNCPDDPGTTEITPTPHITPIGTDSSPQPTLPGSDAYLDNLTLEGGFFFPVFSVAVTDYYGYVPDTASPVILQPELTVAAGIRWFLNGAEVADGNGLDLQNGENALSIIVTSEDGLATETYTLILNKGYLPWAYIKGSRLITSDQFGTCLAMDGDTLAVGTPVSDNPETQVPSCGAVYIFTLADGLWSETAILYAGNGESGDNFGSSIALDGNILVCGAEGEDSSERSVTNGEIIVENNNAANSGAVYIFTNTDGLWQPSAYLKASNADPGDAFGCSVAVSGDTILVGAFDEDSNENYVSHSGAASETNTADHAGAAYVFRLNAGDWIQEAYLKASNAELDDHFGHSVAIDGDRAIIGAWNEDSAGQVVSRNPLQAGTDNDAPLAGAAYIFIREAGIWSQHSYLKASGSSQDDRFGSRVAIDGDIAAVSAQFADAVVPDGGAVYVFEYTATDWAQTAVFTPFNPDDYDLFGAGLSLAGNFLAAGAPFEDSASNIIINSGFETLPDNNSSNLGAVYLYRKEAGTWFLDAYLKAPNCDTDDKFGLSVALSAAGLACGAPMEESDLKGVYHEYPFEENNNADYSGAVYLFNR